MDAAQCNEMRDSASRHTTPGVQETIRSTLSIAHEDLEPATTRELSASDEVQSEPNPASDEAGPSIFRDNHNVLRRANTLASTSPQEELSSRIQPRPQRNVKKKRKETHAPRRTSRKSSKSERPDSSPTQPMDNGPARRLQLLSSFMEVCCPSVRFPNNSRGHAELSWFPALPYLDRSQPVVDSSIEALCMAGLAAVTKDSQMKWISRIPYATALRRLHKVLAQISNVRSQQGYGEFFLSIRILGWFETFDSVTSPGASELDQWEGRLAHLRGAERYVRTCGISTFPSPTSSTKAHEVAWFLSFRHEMILVNLADRTSCIFAKKGWLDFSKAIQSHVSWDAQVRVSQVHDIAVRLPGLQQESDRLPKSVELWRKLAVKVVDVRDRLATWVTSQGDPPTKRPSVQTKSLPYKSFFADSAAHAQCWKFWMLANCTLLRILSLCPPLKGSLPSLYTGNIRREILHLIRSLCRMTPAWLERFAVDARWDLEILTGYFQASGLEVEHRWCEQMIERTGAESAMRDALLRKHYHPWTSMVQAASPAKICLQYRYGSSYEDDESQAIDDDEVGDESDS